MSSATVPRSGDPACEVLADEEPLGEAQGSFGGQASLPASAAAADGASAAELRRILALADPYDLTGFLDCPTTTAPVRHHVKLDGLKLGFRVHFRKLLGVVAWCRELGYVVERSPKWGVLIRGKDFAFVARPTKRNATGRRYDAMLDIKGAAYNANLAPQLVATFVAPCAVVSTIRVTRLDIAVDVELPFSAILAFRKLTRRKLQQWSLDYLQTRPDWPIKRHKRYWNRYAGVDFDHWHQRIVSHFIGTASADYRHLIYDKLQERLDKVGPRELCPEGWRGLEHTVGWTCCTRFEVQIKTSARLRGPLERILLDSENHFDNLHPIDLREVDVSNPMLVLLLQAKVLTAEHTFKDLLADAPVVQALFKERCKAEAHRWPWPHPAELFQAARQQLQEELNGVLGSVPTDHAMAPVLSPARVYILRPRARREGEQARCVPTRAGASREPAEGLRPGGGVRGHGQAQGLLREGASRDQVWGSAQEGSPCRRFCDTGGASGQTLHAGGRGGPGLPERKELLAIQNLEDRLAARPRQSGCQEGRDRPRQGPEG